LHGFCNLDLAVDTLAASGLENVAAADDIERLR
jgi:hypothetical protein